jgi:NDP-sugar pyrophosphorylase family protein
MSKIHIIQPMGGGGTRFAKEGFELPKPLIELVDKPFLYWSTASLYDYVDEKDLTFVVLQEHIDKFKIDEVIKKYYADADIIVIPHILNGAVLTALNGIKNIKDDSPIIINDCDHAFRCSDFEKFINSNNTSDIDCALLTFESSDPKYSFLEMDENDNVIHTVEKKAVSTHAICGAYYFRNAEMFKKYAEKYLNNCDYDEFFMSGVYNEMANDGLKIKNFTCDFHIPFGTPDEYEKARTEEMFK